MATSLLSEHRRSQLDSIVMKMEANGEKPETIQFVVNDFKTKYAGGSEQPQADNRGMLRKGWDALKVPEQKSREGLQMIAQAVTPKTETTGNMARDVAMNTPRIAAETLSEVAPGFVSPLSLALMGGGQGLKLAGKIPAVKSMGSGVAAQMESLSGAKPGSIETVAKDATLFGSKGKKAVQGMYEDAKKLSGPIREELGDTANKMEFVQKALQFAKDKTLTPLEALEARKTLSAIKKSVTGEFFRKANEAFDSVAKTAFKGADAAYKRASMAESLRQVFPQNKYGGTSAFKLGLQSIADSDTVAGLLFRGALSPLAQGTAAATAGVAARTATNPRLASSLPALMQAISNRQRKNKK